MIKTIYETPKYAFENNQELFNTHENKQIEHLSDKLSNKALGESNITESSE